jgi:hypothetical protein
VTIRPSYRPPSHRRSAFETPAGVRSLLDRLVADVRAALGDEVFSAAFADGEHLTLDQIIAYAAEEAGHA